MALRANTLGYSNERVNQAAFEQILNGNNLTRASLIELEAAELFVGLIPSAQMVKFAKNGSNATTAAVKLARSFTGKRYVCVPRQHPFFSFDDWFIGSTVVKRGVPEDHASNTLLFDYNDLGSLEILFEKYPDQIAAVMLEPATSTTPCLETCEDLSFTSACNQCSNSNINFLAKVQELCKGNGALFILDEMITGFRWSLAGAAPFFGVEPDLLTFGKAMANGFSLAAVTGRREVMELGGIDKQGQERTFLLSTTHGGEMASLGAFVETMKIYKEQFVCQHLWNYGEKLKDGINGIAAELGVDKHFSIVGPSISLNYQTLDQNMQPSAGFRTLFAQEMLNKGVLMPWIAVSLSHRDEELNFTLVAAEHALKIYRRALSEGLTDYLCGTEVKPVFRRFN